jgi:phenylacetate-CoA ligase
MKTYDWKELAALAKQKSPFYAELYKNCQTFADLADLPIIDQASYWNANTIRNNRVLTADMTDGIVFKSGGTTGNPKFSIYTRDEWNLFTQVFGEGMSKAGLAQGDRIANLFYVGELYASFIFIMKSIELAPLPALQFPISGATAAEGILKTIYDFEINVLAGLPTTLLNVAEYYAQNADKYCNLKVDKIMFGGESMYPDQRERLEKIFPGVNIVSVGYASVDAGLLGYADTSCGIDEHRAFGRHTIMEIVDEDTLEPINEPKRPGKLLITNLTRALMPIIRYPVGDRACWAEAASGANTDRKFVILGRSEEAARVGPVSVYYEDMRAFLVALSLRLQIIGFQLLIKHHDKKDELTVRLAIPDPAHGNSELNAKIATEFGLQRTMFAEAVRDNKIHPLSIEWIEPDQLEINSRTGKLRRVIDQRA